MQRRVVASLVLFLSWVGPPADGALRILLPERQGVQMAQALAPAGETAAPEIRSAITSRLVRVVIVAEWLEAADHPELFAWLRKELGATGRAAGLQLSVMRDGQILPVAETRSFARLETTLRELLAGQPQEASQTGDPLRTYDLLASSIPAAAETWSRLIWAGRAPALPEGVLRDYVHARIFQVLGEGRAWLELWPPQQETSLPALGPFPAAPVVEFSWEPRAGRAGFEIRRIAVGGRDLWYLAVAPDLSLPAFQAFGCLVDAETAASAEAAGAAEPARLSRALSAFPVWERALFTGARLAERIKDYSAAAAFLERLIEIHPAEAQLWRRYAVAVSESAAPASAEPVLRRAVEIVPKDAELWERLARLRVSQGDAAEGYKFLRRSLEIDPEHAPLWWRAADLARQSGDSGGEREALGGGLRRRGIPYRAGFATSNC